MNKIADFGIKLLKINRFLEKSLENNVSEHSAVTKKHEIRHIHW